MVLTSCHHSDKKSHEIAANSKLIEISPVKIDLGEIIKKDSLIVPIKVVLSNKNDSLVSIKDVTPSCGCISIVDAPNSIQAHDADTLSIVIDMANQSGHLSKSVFLKYGNNEVAMIKITGDIME